MQVQSLGQEDPLEQGMATHSKILLENSMDRGFWWAIVHGVTESQTWLCTQAPLAYLARINLRRSDSWPHPTVLHPCFTLTSQMSSTRFFPKTWEQVENVREECVSEEKTPQRDNKIKMEMGVLWTMKINSVTSHWSWRLTLGDVSLLDFENGRSPIGLKPKVTGGLHWAHTFGGWLHFD